MSLNELFLSTCLRFYCSNANKYASRCELFLQNEYTGLFPKHSSAQKCLKKLCRNYNYVSQTEFHQIVMWGRENLNLKRDSSGLGERINENNGLLRILSCKIQPNEETVNA